MMRNEIKTEKAPAAIGPYSQGIATDKMVFLSGQLGINPDTNEMAIGIINQTKQVFENIQILLAQDNLSFTNVVKITVFLNDLSQMSEMNQVYQEYVVAPYPARSAYQVTRLPLDALVEIEVIAVK